MLDKIFVDTNILVYAHDLSAGRKNTTARNLIQELWENRTGCLSIQVLQEFFVTVTQKVPQPMEIEPAKSILQDLSYWKIHEPKANDVIQAVNIQARHRVSFWDAMILQSAIQLECSLIWSEDFNPGQVYNNLKVVNPFQV
jgi:predicted nucleic acid-binding protein